MNRETFCSVQTKPNVSSSLCKTLSHRRGESLVRKITQNQTSHWFSNSDYKVDDWDINTDGGVTELWVFFVNFKIQLVVSSVLHL